MFSFYYPSRLNFHLANGKRYDNENLRTDVNRLTYKDGYSGEYSYIYVDRSPDVGTTDFGSLSCLVQEDEGEDQGKPRRSPSRSRPGRASPASG